MILELHFETIELFYELYNHSNIFCDLQYYRFVSDSLQVEFHCLGKKEDPFYKFKFYNVMAKVLILDLFWRMSMIERELKCLFLCI